MYFFIISGLSAKPAGSDNHGFSVDVERLAVFIFSNNAGNFAVFAENQFFSRSVQENLHAVFVFALLLKGVNPASAAALINMPCVEAAPDSWWSVFRT